MYIYIHSYSSDVKVLRNRCNHGQTHTRIWPKKDHVCVWCVICTQSKQWINCQISRRRCRSWSPPSRCHSAGSALPIPAATRTAAWAATPPAAARPGKTLDRTVAPASWWAGRSGWGCCTPARGEAAVWPRRSSFTLTSPLDISHVIQLGDRLPSMLFSFDLRVFGWAASVLWCSCCG